MKVHSYTYRGKTVDVYKATVSDIENSLKDKNYLEFTDKGITTRLFVKALNVNDQSQSITVDFFFKEVVKSTTGEGVDIETETFASKSLSETSIGSYVNLYKSEVEGMLGDFIRHGQFDILALAKNYKTGSYFIGEMAYPCNSLNNYSWMQPLSYDLTTTETGVTVTVVDTLESYNLEYSLDGETYQDLVETEIPLEVGSYTITVRAKEELYPFPSNFSILEPVIEDDLIQENE